MNHWSLFTKFVRAELGVGGPDAQLQLVDHLPEKDADALSRVWAIGCYCSHHTIQGAFAVYKNFPNPIRVIRRPLELRRFLKDHWEGLPLRREMRSHQMLDKRTDCLLSFANYTVNGRWARGGYESVWDSSIEDVRYYGRYMALKYLELLRMSVRPKLILTDLRAKHAWSPRIALALLYPQHHDVFMDRGDNSTATIALVERYAAKLHRKLTRKGIDLNFFQLQVLLCNYKQAIHGRFYPGMGLDEEMMYSDVALKFFDMRPLYRLRKQLFKRRHLGELSGWHGIRQDNLQRWKTLGASIR